MVWCSHVFLLFNQIFAAFNESDHFGQHTCNSVSEEIKSNIERKSAQWNHINAATIWFHLHKIPFLIERLLSFLRKRSSINWNSCKNSFSHSREYFVMLICGFCYGFYFFLTCAQFGSAITACTRGKVITNQCQNYSSFTWHSHKCWRQANIPKWRRKTKQQQQQQKTRRNCSKQQQQSLARVAQCIETQRDCQTRYIRFEIVPYNLNFQFIFFFLSLSSSFPVQHFLPI